MTKTDVRAKKVEEAIKLAYDSLQSHLKWTHNVTSEGKRFHKKAIKEYARIITLLTELY